MNEKKMSLVNLSVNELEKVKAGAGNAGGSNCDLYKIISDPSI